jgi:thiosulfate/3-mercaptopyruvate sulfurtransferase
MSDQNPFFVTPDWLQERLGQPGLKIVDGSWYLPAQKRDARAEYDSGHIPGAVFFDHDKVVDPDSGLPHTLPALSLAKDGKMLPPEALREKFEAAGVDLSKPVFTSCGSGVTAAVLTLALETIGHKNNRLYDGSWSEWGGRSDTPVETGSK